MFLVVQWLCDLTCSVLSSRSVQPSGFDFIVMMMGRELAMGNTSCLASFPLRDGARVSSVFTLSCTVTSKHIFSSKGLALHNIASAFYYCYCYSALEALAVITPKFPHYWAQSRGGQITVLYIKITPYKQSVVNQEYEYIA